MFAARNTLLGVTMFVGSSPTSSAVLEKDIMQIKKSQAKPNLVGKAIL